MRKFLLKPWGAAISIAVVIVAMLLPSLYVVSFVSRVEVELPLKMIGRDRALSSFILDISALEDRLYLYSEVPNVKHREQLDIALDILYSRLQDNRSVYFENMTKRMASGSARLEKIVEIIDKEMLQSNPSIAIINEVRSEVTQIKANIRHDFHIISQQAIVQLSDNRRDLASVGNAILLLLSIFLIFAVGLVFLLILQWRSIRSQRTANIVMRGRNTVMEMLNSGASLSKILLEIERVNDAVGSTTTTRVLLLDDEGKRLRPIEAHHVFHEMLLAVGGIHVVPDRGTSGPAAFLDERVITEDISQDPRWSNLRKFADARNFKACWAEPLRSSRDKVLGTITVFSKRIGQPNAEELEQLTATVQLASLAIERHRTAQDLQEAIQRAEYANRSKSNFLASMSHELRTPLNAVIGFAEILESQLWGALGHPKYDEYVKDISRSGRHLLSLINDILDLSRIEAGKLDYQEEDVDLCECADNAAHMFDLEIQKSDISFHVEHNPTQIHLLADRRAVMQMMINLLSNAIKFTEPGGQVNFSVVVDESDQILIRVHDTGIGIASDQIDRLLRPFERLESAATSNIEGTGLGLSLVKAFAEEHDGTFVLESEIGVGTTAAVIFPSSRLLPLGEVSAVAAPSNAISGSLI